MQAERYLTLDDWLQVRRTHVPRACPLHYEQSPIKADRASKQYIYDEYGNKYLDFFNCMVHVGHCEPQVQTVSYAQMRRIGPLSMSRELYNAYVDRLKATLPSSLSVCYFVTSGSIANTLALYLAKMFTKREDVIVFDDCYHGNLLTVSELSIRNLKRSGRTPEEWVHVLPCPNTFRGPYKEADPETPEKYFVDAKRFFDQLETKNKQPACMISESIFTASGMLIPPEGYLKKLYSLMHEHGGICIASEMQLGLGRTGEQFWGFQTQGLVPDIMTVGKPLGNGYPMAAVFTTREIAECADLPIEEFRGNAVMWTVGMAVLDILETEKLIDRAKDLGNKLKKGLQSLLRKHQNIGDVRGMGLAIGVEIVHDKLSYKAYKELAEKIVYRMRERKLLIANDGPKKNILYFMPPLCISDDDVNRMMTALHEILTDLENQLPFEIENMFPSFSRPLIPVHVLQPGSEIGASSAQHQEDEEHSAALRYQEMD